MHLWPSCGFLLEFFLLDYLHAGHILGTWIFIYRDVQVFLVLLHSQATELSTDQLISGTANVWRPLYAGVKYETLAVSVTALSRR